MHTFSNKGIRPLILACLMMGCAQNAVADAFTHGTLVSRDEQGQKQDMPLVSTRVAMEIKGSVLRAQVTQVFHNPTDNWAEALPCVST
jgi:Ca-activated chloride channel family protein